MIQGFSSGLIGNRELIYETDLPSFQRDFASVKTLDHGTGPAITFTRASGATYFDVNGTLQTASNDAPRFDHDPANGASRGLLIEEARTNLLERSAEFDNAYWTKTRASVTANAIAAPDGATTADKLVENTDNNTHFVHRARTTASNETVTFSVFAKAGERSSLLLELSNFLNSVTNATFDLTAKTASTPLFAGADYSNLSSSITEIGNGWFRCVLTATKAAVNTVNNPTISLHNGTSSTYTGDGTSGLYIWGAQLEAGAFPTSYIPTTSAAATRSADSAVVTPISGFYNQAEGTLFAEFSRYQTAAVANFLHFTGTSPNQIVLETNATPPSTLQRFLVETSAGAQANIGFSGVVANTVYRMIGAYAANSFQAAQSGTLGTEDTGGALPTVSQMTIGAGKYGTDALFKILNGHIRKLAYYPKCLSNALLQQLTT